jgi:hypothetical protein
MTLSSAEKTHRLINQERRPAGFLQKSFELFYPNKNQGAVFTPRYGFLPSQTV